tara:strand:+ start:6072 stop:7448 length:1377 start_codon:yes stop_codon:yes gene_type:complete
MSKNVVWWTAIVNKRQDFVEKYGGYNYFEYSRKTWEYWCQENDCIFVPFTEPVEKDLIRFRPNWQKTMFVFDELERLGIDYDQIALIDSTHMMKWNAPNIFNFTDGKLSAMRDIDNMRWIYDSIQGYKKFFNDFDFDSTKYVNSSPMIINKKHRDLILSFKELYYDNTDMLIKLQDEIVKKGTEQTPINYWIQINNVDLNIDLPLPFKLTHMNRKEMFNHNWQLNEDKTPFFIKYGYDWVFNGIPKEQRSSRMKQTWDIVKDNYVSLNEKTKNILDEVFHKDVAKYTTSRKFKEDILNYFSDKKYKEMKVLELGCCQGDGTKIYSEVFGKVYAVDNSQENIDKAKKLCEDKNNIEFLLKDVYKLEWDFPKDIDVVVVDAGHTSQLVSYDIDRCLSNLDSPILIMDDYGNPNQDIKKAINAKVSDKKINIDRFIGEDDGFICVHGLSFDDREGVICTSK